MFHTFLDISDGAKCDAAAIRLRRIYRNPATSDEEIQYKNSTVRLRDAVPTPGDYALWESLASPSRLEEEWVKDAVFLTAENERSGAINGKRIVESGAGIHSVYSYFSSDAARKRKARTTEFDGIPSNSNFVVGGPVMLLTNSINETPVVKLGLSNGSRGVLRGVSYKAVAGVVRPEYLYIDFATYRGPEFFPGRPNIPKTLVPIPLQKIEKKQDWIFGFPVKTAYSLTIHKSQGLGFPEGTVVDWRVSRMPVQLSSQMGLPFVASTRSKTVAKTAFINLPAYTTFLSARESKTFRARCEVEARIDILHGRTMRRVYGEGYDELALHRTHNELHGLSSKGLENDLARPGVLKMDSQTLA